MPRVKKFGKVNKKKLAENAAKARDIRNYSVLARRTTVNKRDLEGESQLSQEKAAIDYLSILLDDISKHYLWHAYEISSKVGKGLCLHAATIGSSQVKKLGQESFKNPKILHARLYNSTARLVGSKWESHFEDQVRERSEPGKLCVHSYVAQKTAYSTILPWLCATPDYIASVSEGSSRKARLSIIEIKSTASEAAFKATLAANRVQVEVAIDCFGLDVGYLITYYEQGDIIQTSVHKLTSGYLLANAERLNRQYAAYLSNFVFVSTNYRIDAALIEERLLSVPRKPMEPLDLCALGALPSFAPKPRCAYHTHYKYTGDKAFKSSWRIKSKPAKSLANLILLEDCK